jgi:hypothetical protein
MSFSFAWLVRLLVLLAVGSTILAVGISRLDPPRPDWRARRPAGHVSVNEYYLEVTDRMPRWLDVESGEIAAHPLADGDVLEAATCSPWVDERGRRQVVGRWSSRSPNGPSSTSHDFGLARYAFPGGEMLDKVSTEIVPVGPPCWFPGTRAQILFAAGDGVLYRHAFETPTGLKQVADAPEGQPQPRPLAWRCRPPGLGNVYVSDLNWPEDPRLGGRVLVALRVQAVDPRGGRSLSRTQLWWLKLNHAGREIVEAGRLMTPDRTGSGPEEFDERFPAVARLPGGRLVLAYLRQRPGQRGWELRSAPLRIDDVRHTPTSLESECRVLGDHYQAAPPAFSGDGRWINVISGSASTGHPVARVAVEADHWAEVRP